jgi:hypothetical protein
MSRKRQSFFLLLLVLGLVGVGAISMAQQPVAASPAQQANGYYSFSVKFVCGKQGSEEVEQAAVRPGIYATEINIHNYLPKEAPLRKRVIPLVIDREVFGREPRFGEVRGWDDIVLPPDTATLDDCARITRLLGLAPDTHVIGFLEIISPHDLNVDAVYTVEGRYLYNTDIDVERVEGKFVSS